MTRETEIIKKELQQAEYIGEDGGMVVDAKFTQLGAYRKMRQRWIEDCGKEEWEDFKENSHFSPADLGIGFLHLVTDENRDELDFDTETEWYVSTKDKSPYKLWVYWG
jgi:hypothetical protein